MLVVSREQFPSWLSGQMRRRDWNQVETARKLGTHSSVISRWLTGERVPDTKSIDRVADLFGAVSGRIIYSARLGQVLDALIVAAKLPRITAHGFRHGFVTTLLESGASPKTVASLVGDSVQTVMRVYSQVVESSRETAIRDLDELFAGADSAAKRDASTTT
jgi:integrase